MPESLEETKTLEAKEQASAEQKQQEGLQEGQTYACEPEANQQETTKGASAEEHQGGLQEGLKHDASEEAPAAAEPELDEAAKMLGANVAKAAQASLQEGSETGTLTSSRLKLHDKTKADIQGLKEGHLSEDAFWMDISK